ncbi:MULTISPECIES: hypothetical protein [unclassified Moorena]|uniref:hypothetical protein n=1 Tax=unclassified Moorena TaxID=2683338 RepID=UPI0013C55423|nr:MULTISPECIES: hypothetical protein [unclassified Moorena]NEO19495.1 hypothetical protein [Moorena sp. SIO4A5]NEO88999.1 hypothetical protein [Moorena sp. SIO3G5]NEQ57847.1 hypothetical protein [Moorena sp. SIO4A1]
MLPGQGKSSLKTQSLAVGHATRTTTNRCVNPGKSQLERKMVRWGTPEPGEKEGKRTF